MKKPVAAIILAAGQGTRMKSDLHKVLHPVAGQPMLHHVLDHVAQIGAQRIIVVVGSQGEQVAASVAGRGVDIVVQQEQLGTGHAVLQARETLAGFEGDVLVLYGDVPLIQPATLDRMIAALDDHAHARSVVLGFRPPVAGMYGRILTSDNFHVDKMVEAKDASPEELNAELCNTGLIAARAPQLFELLTRIGNDNAAGEYYLPDVVMLPGQRSVFVEVEAWEATGVNNRVELSAVETLWQDNARRQVQLAGVTMTAPESVWLAHDTVIGRDVTIEPNVFFGKGVTVADNASIRAFSHIEGAVIGERCEVGPYARLRPGTVLESGAKVGNFVELKKSTLGRGAKANHLSYIGDAEVGADANIGAGTITCNYDGYFKHKTVIGERAFIGSNSALIAPVRIGADAIVGAGSAVSRDVAAGELRLVRAEQLVKPGWADRFHDAMKKKKAERPK